MATGGVSEKISIGDLAQTPPPTEFDGEEESFVVLGRSPTSFMYSDNASLMLRDALKSLSVENEAPKTSERERDEAKWSTVKKEEEEVKTENDNNIEPTLKTSTSNLANLSLDEIQAKVDRMVVENLELKETLQQNNMAMKKQCETILQWQEDVQRVHDSHKAKFDETKHYIEKLQMENLHLKNQLGDIEERERALQKKLNEAPISVQKTSFDNVHQFQLEAAQKKIALFEVILKERDETIGRLQRQLQSAEKLKQVQLQQLEEYQKEKWELTQRIVDKEKELNAEKNASAQRKSDLEQENKQLQEAYAVLAQNTRATSTPIAEEELENVRQQLMNAQMHITNLELAKSKFQQMMNDKEVEIQGLEKLLTDARAEKSDEHAALVAQLDVYRTDYEAEASARSSLMAEKNQIAEDLHSLQRRNQQLIEEVERLRNHTDFVHVGRRRTSETSSASTESPPPLRYACPLCGQEFRSLRFVEEHVEHCVNNAP